MKKNKFFCTLLSLLIFTTLGSCKPNTSENSLLGTITTTETTSSIVTTTSTENTTSANATVSEKLSSDIFSFQIQLNGKIYQLPASVSEFMADGWHDEENFIGTLNAGEMKNAFLYNGDQVIYAIVNNRGKDVLKLSECSIGYISVDSDEAKKGTNLILPGGITIGSDLNDVKKAYGEPWENSEGEQAVVFRYLKEYNTVAFLIDPKTKKVMSIEISVV